MNLNDVPFAKNPTSLLTGEVEISGTAGVITFCEYSDNGYLLVIVECADGSVHFKQWDRNGKAVIPIQLLLKSLQTASMDARNFMFGQAGVKK
jgi:hypothetical protein